LSVWTPPRAGDKVGALPSSSPVGNAKLIRQVPIGFRELGQLPTARSTLRQADPDRKVVQGASPPRSTSP